MMTLLRIVSVQGCNRKAVPRFGAPAPHPHIGIVLVIPVEVAFAVATDGVVAGHPYRRRWSCEQVLACESHGHRLVVVA